MNSRKKRILLFMLIILCLLFFNKEWYRFTKKEPLNILHLKTLKENGEKALDHLDIPVSALILYKNKIIGSGYNTILQNNNAGGHAEINAISDALKNIGHDEFSRLNRDSISLVTSYEPCLMCKGAIINYRIKNVSFIQKKGFWEHNTNTMKSLMYEFRKKKSQEDTLQEFLFKKHPNYPHK